MYFISNEEAQHLSSVEIEELEMYQVEVDGTDGGWEIPEECLEWQSKQVQKLLAAKYNLAA